MKLVSVIMPTYKRPDHISRAIDSLLKQTYHNLEVIIVNDNIKDGSEYIQTRNVVAKYLSDERIKYIENDCNIGGAESRNVGILKSRGEYITFLDDDDVYLPQKVEIQLNEMLMNNWDVSVMDGETYDVNDRLLSRKTQMISNDMSQLQLLKTHILFHITGTNTFMFRREVLTGIGGFDNVPACHEYILMQKAIMSDYKIGYINKGLIKNYICAGERLSTSSVKIMAQTMLLEEKKKHFNILTYKEKRVVLCRHYGVLFNLSIKAHCYQKAISCALKCFLISPVQAVKWYNEYKGKVHG